MTVQITEEQAVRVGEFSSRPVFFLGGYAADGSDVQQIANRLEAGDSGFLAEGRG